MRVVDLALESSLGPIGGLIFGVKIYPAVGMGSGHDLHFQVEVFERLVIADIKQVATIAVGNESATFNFPGIRVFFGLFPAVKSFAVKELDETVVGVGGENRLERRKQNDRGEGEEQISFHAAENKPMVRSCKAKSTLMVRLVAHL